MKKILLAAASVFLFAGAKAQTKNFIDQPYIEVAGNVDTLITPDEIFIKIILSEKDTKDRTSVEELEGKMVAALKGLGINTEKNLTTSDMASNFRQYLFKGKDVLKTKEYLLKVSDAVTASKVFIQLESLDISNTSIDHVDYSEMESLRNFMCSKAIENAKTRAVALTKPLNQTVGIAINITDGDMQDLSRGLPGSAAGVTIRLRGIVSNSGYQQELPNIDFQKIPVATSVNVKFVLK